MLCVSLFRVHQPLVKGSKFLLGKPTTKDYLDSLPKIDGGIDYVEYDSLFGDRTSLRTNFLYSFTDNITVGLGGKWGDDVTEYALTGRFYFGQ